MCTNQLPIKQCQQWITLAEFLPKVLWMYIQHWYNINQLDPKNVRWKSSCSTNWEHFKLQISSKFGYSVHQKMTGLQNERTNGSEDIGLNVFHWAKYVMFPNGSWFAHATIKYHSWNWSKCSLLLRITSHINNFRRKHWSEIIYQTRSWDLFTNYHI